VALVHSSRVEISVEPPVLYGYSLLTIPTTMIAPPPQSQSELHLLCVSAIVRDLISTHSSTSHTVVPNVNQLRLKYAKKYNLSAIPRLTDVLSAVPEEWKDRLRGWLRAKPVRTASGVAVVAVMCKPHRCPHVAMTGNICV
jgi:elongator complex protein 3